MRATAFEFNHRFWLIGVIFWLGFTLGSVDHVNAAVGLLHLFKPTLSLDGAEGARLVRLIFVSGAVVVFLAALLRTWATAYLRADVVHDFRMHSEKHVADGPFRYVRNPLYLGNVMMAAGVGVMTSRLGGWCSFLA